MIRMKTNNLKYFVLLTIMIVIFYFNDSYSNIGLRRGYSIETNKQDKLGYSDNWTLIDTLYQEKEKKSFIIMKSLFLSSFYEKLYKNENIEYASDFVNNCIQSDSLFLFYKYSDSLLDKYSLDMFMFIVKPLKLKTRDEILLIPDPFSDIIVVSDDTIFFPLINRYNSFDKLINLKYETINNHQYYDDSIALRKLILGESD